MDLLNSTSYGFMRRRGNLQMDVTIREAKETDLRLVRKYTVETAWATFSESERKELDKEKWTKHVLELFEKLSKRETDRIFVAEDESHAFLGYLWVGEGSNMMTGLKQGYIFDIFVKKEFRGKGIGKILLEKAQSYCREKGYSRILLRVFVNNANAIGLYNRMGFKTEQMHMGKALS
jgi:ribosomal protein S18 acetylase RimI-like enzyme